ncbi:hypothetical protein [Ancylobacter amanitiformis]|uniref:Phage tail tape measure protein n=1 Tax=Ancylobacter amanitiformis TaxID=217069 RepID=A0ABU0LQB3_9HYPH|nr:hypothetical protein [Ancylobacter amanitiformis]MDQ0510869.1 hypothetical protein [Ancylobacter amanitiformis]
MARTYEANVILGLKDQLSKGAPKAAAAVDALGKTLDRAEKKAREFAATAGKAPNWGGGFQKQVDRLRLSVAEMERLKASWVSLSKEIGANGNKAFQTAAATRWKNEALASILSVREAQRQLSEDGIREAKAQAEAEKKAAADAAKERARLAKDEAKAREKAAQDAERAAKDAARAQVKAARETERAANEAAKAQARASREAAKEAAKAAADGTRAARTAFQEATRAARESAREQARLARETTKAQRDAAKEQARIAEEAAREKAKLARDAARIAKEEARQASAEAKRRDREASHARREHLRQEARERRRLVGFGSDTVRNLGYAAGLGGGTYLAGRGIRATALSAAELEREKARDYLGGLSPNDTARIQARSFQTSAQVRAVDAATMHNLLRETSLTNVGVDGALKLAPDLARGMAVVSSMKSPDEALSALTRLLRGLDTLGKNVDIDVIRTLLDGFIRAQGVEGAEFSVGDVYTTAKRSKSGGFSLNDRFLTRILPALISDLGPDQVGTALGSSVSQVVGGRATKSSMAEQRRYGLRGKNGDFVNQDLFLSDPFEYTEKVLMPALRKQGIDTNNDMAVTAAMSKLFSNQRVADLFGRMVLQADQYLNKERKMNQAPGLAAGEQMSEKDPFVAGAGALDQLKNAVGALVEPITPAAISGLNAFADVLSRTAAWLKESGMAGTVLGAGAGVAGVAGAGYGAYKIWSTLSGGFGLQSSAVALNESAAALTAAAARLGGAGVSSAATTAAGAAAGGSAVAAGAVVGGVIAGGAGLAAAATNIVQQNREMLGAIQDNPMLGAMDPGMGLAAAVYGPNGRQAAQDAGSGIGSDVVAGLKARAPEIEQASQSIFDRIRAIFGFGVDVPVRVQPSSMAFPGVGMNRAGARGPEGLGIDSAGRATGPGRASGGHVYAGGLYMINELGQEGFVPDQSGTVVPADKMARMGQGGRGAGAPAGQGSRIGPFTFHIHGSRDDAQEIAEKMTRELAGVFGDYGLDFA